MGNNGLGEIRQTINLGCGQLTPLPILKDLHSCVMFVSYTEAIPSLFPSTKTGYSRAMPVNTPTPGPISTDKTQAVKSSDRQEETATVVASSVAPTTEGAPETSAVAVDGRYYFPF